MEVDRETCRSRAAIPALAASQIRRHPMSVCDTEWAVEWNGKSVYTLAFIDEESSLLKAHCHEQFLGLLNQDTSESTFGGIEPKRFTDSQTIQRSSIVRTKRRFDNMSMEEAQWVPIRSVGKCTSGRNE
eukprot:8297789-Prorocentrum_lima.AAC.1